jgi:hypothetical protein
MAPLKGRGKPTIFNNIGLICLGKKKKTNNNNDHGVDVNIIIII